jgi:hypothetical protein
LFDLKGRLIGGLVILCVEETEDVFEHLIEQEMLEEDSKLMMMMKNLNLRKKSYHC